MPRLADSPLLAPRVKRRAYTRGSPDRLCQQCQRIVVRDLLLCSTCFARSEDGRQAAKRRQLLNSYTLLPDGGPCASC